MKRKAWELAPLFIAAAIAFGYAVGLGHMAASPTVAAPRTSIGALARPSTGSGDPTRPEHFLPDRASKPDPSAPPDSNVPPDPKAAADPRAPADPSVSADPRPGSDRAARPDPSAAKDPN